MDVYFTLDARKPLERLNALQNGLGDATKEPLRGGFVRAGLVYFQDMRRRFEGAMNGDGTWPRLAPSTVKDKRGDTRILFRTGALFNDIPPANFNRALEIAPGGLKVYIVNRVAKFHQKGNRRLPQRKIFVDPRPQARLLMIQAITEAANRTVAQIWPNARKTA